uniref:Uncharacterized protein n=1 Tax=Oryza meridionalis TaxID=40149 RepID=A0A0E0DQA2_9ORYZ
MVPVPPNARKSEIKLSAPQQPRGGNCCGDDARAPPAGPSWPPPRGGGDGDGAASVPPNRPEGYSTSDNEVDGPGKYFSEEDEEEEAAEEFVEDIVAEKEWEGFTLEYDHGSDADEDVAE